MEEVPIPYGTRLHGFVTVKIASLDQVNDTGLLILVIYPYIKIIRLYK